MSEAQAEHESGVGSRGERSGLILAGRLRQKTDGYLKVELVEGLTVDIAEEDCTYVAEVTDPATLRSTVTVYLKGNQPISATFQPHLYRVLAEASTVPFAFGSAAGVPPDQFVFPLLADAPSGPGGGSGDRVTMVSTRTWFGTVREDGTKSDAPNESDEIFIP